MSGSRAIRGTRAKIFFYICVLLIITGLIACYNNTLSQLDDVRKSNDICRQQEENLSTQLQVISDYKQRLEKSLKSEKADHLQTKVNYENRLNEERNKNDKTFGDAKLKFNSLQQHYNLLQTEYDDFKEECSKNQQRQQEDVNDLQAKLEELREELKKVKSSKESLKTDYEQLSSHKENIEKELKKFQNVKGNNESQIYHLMLENSKLKKELEKANGNVGVPEETLKDPKAPVQSALLQGVPNLSSTSPVSPKASGVKPVPPANAEQHVLAKPSDNEKMASSKSTTKSGLKPSTGSLNGARPLLIPTVTPETIQKVDGNPQVPEGVVPVGNEQQNEQAELVNNRYRNVKETANEDKKANLDIERENGANEEFDAPHQNGFDGLQFGGDDRHKSALKQTGEKRHIDNLAVNHNRNYDQDQAEYKELQNDVQLEENEEDDDAEGYDDHLVRQKDAVVRN